MKKVKSGKSLNMKQGDVKEMRHENNALRKKYTKKVQHKKSAT